MPPERSAEIFGLYALTRKATELANSLTGFKNLSDTTDEKQIYTDEMMLAAVVASNSANTTLAPFTTLFNLPKEHRLYIDNNPVFKELISDKTKTFTK